MYGGEVVAGGGDDGEKEGHAAGNGAAEGRVGVAIADGRGRGGGFGGLGGDEAEEGTRGARGERGEGVGASERPGARGRWRHVGVGAPRARVGQVGLGQLDELARPSAGLALARAELLRSLTKRA